MENLKFLEKPVLFSPRLIIGLSGWMDGGYVSTGTIVYLNNKLNAIKFAEINPHPFYIYNLPGSMEEIAQFRPYTKITDGLVNEVKFPTNEFFADTHNNLILFSGKEPNINWDQYCQILFFMCEEYQIQEIYFIGSVNGLTPHTRDPRVYSSVSNEKLKKILEEENIRFTTYEGSASLTTYLTFLTKERNINMINLITDVPMYIHATNPRGIISIVKKVKALLQLNLDFSDLIPLVEQFDSDMAVAMREQPELAKQVKKLEENYDNEIVTDNQNFEEWLKKHGIDNL